jgi:hypothetical protein
MTFEQAVIHLRNKHYPWLIELLEDVQEDGEAKEDISFWVDAEAIRCILDVLHHTPLDELVYADPVQFVSHSGCGT